MAKVSVWVALAPSRRRSTNNHRAQRASKSSPGGVVSAALSVRGGHRFLATVRAETVTGHGFGEVR